MPAIATLLDISERAARDWVRRHNVPRRGERPVLVSEEAVLALLAAEGRHPRKPPEATPEVAGRAEPIEATYRVAGEPALPLVPLATMVEELRGLAAELATLATRNEALAVEVGTLRERSGRQEQDNAELRRRAERAEARVAELQGEVERAHAAASSGAGRREGEGWAEYAPRVQWVDGAREDPPPPPSPPGFWQRLRRLFPRGRDDEE